MLNKDGLAHANNAERGNLAALGNVLRAIIDGSLTITAATLTTLTGGTVDVTTTFKRNGVDKTAALDVAIVKGAQHNITVPYPIPELRQQAAMSTALPTAGNGTALGVAAAAGSVLLGSTSNNTSITEKAAYEFVVPEDYVAGQNITVRLRSKVGIARQVAQTVAASAKLIADGVLGSELIATAAQAVTLAYANYDFVITGTTLTAGNRLVIVITLVGNDTGGAGGAAAMSVSEIQSLVPVTT